MENGIKNTGHWGGRLKNHQIPNQYEKCGLKALMKDMPMVKWNENQSFVRYPLLDKPYLYTVNFKGEQWRMASLANPELTLYIGINLNRYQANIRRRRFYYFAGLLVVILAIGGGAYLISNRALKPVEAIAHTARLTSSKDLSQRISGSSDYDEEFDSLISVINEMMDRLETSFHQALRFSSDASHELKTPLAIIQSEISTRLQTVESGSSEQETLNRLMDEVERLKRIIRSLFLLSQADAGKMPLSVESYNFSEQLESFAIDADILAEEFGLTIETSIEPGLMVRADELMLGQVIQNLISNALKHNHTGGHVKWQLKGEDERLCFAIENSGPAIPPDDQAHIFERFFRGGCSSDDKASGLGLGLSLAREIVLAHGGQLDLVSSDSKSTLFELNLPTKNSNKLHCL